METEEGINIVLIQNTPLVLQHKNKGSRLGPLSLKTPQMQELCLTYVSFFPELDLFLGTF